MVFSVFNASGVLPTVQGLYDILYRKNLMQKTTQTRYPRPDTPRPETADNHRIAIFMTFNDMAGNNMPAIHMPAISTLAPLAHAGHGPIDASHPAHFLTSPEHSVVILAILASVACLVWLAARRAYRISKPT
jgi:hypothetical protein